MPLHVDIRINEKLIKTLHIGRLKGGTRPDDVNTYAAVLGDPPIMIEDWKRLGASYEHRYGDGALVCVQKAIAALEGEGGEVDE